MIDPLPLAHPSPPTTPRILNVFCALAALLAAAVAFGTRAPNSDVFMALAGGRDVAQGKLGQPDDWSFVTNNRVWINQSWLAHRAIFAVWKLGGENALLVARGAMIVLLALGVILWLRARNASLAVACIISSLILVASRNGLTLRGNLVTLTATPWLLYLLDRQRRGSIHWTWLIAALLAVWTHCHGGFVFGLGVMLLWIILHSPIMADMRGRLSPRRWFALLACLIVAGVLPLLTGPFGTQTYTQSFSMAALSEWRSIREWQPLVRSWNDLKVDLSDAFWDVGPLLVLAALLVLLTITTGVKRMIRGRGDSGTADWPLRIFHAGLILVTGYMAYTGRRFAPLAAILLALPLAACLEYLWKTACCTPRLISLLWCAALAAACYPVYMLGYSRDHPFYPPQSAFARQTMGNNFPVAAIQFMQDNGIAGNVVHDYGVETYLNWTLPEAKVFCGGRAQQIYTETDLTRLRAFQDQRPQFLMPPIMQKRNDIYIQRNVNAILYPTATLWPLIMALNDSRVWLPVFFDGDQALLIRTVDARGEPLPQFSRFAQGRMDRKAVAIIDPDEEASGEKSRNAARAGLVVFRDEDAYRYSRALYLTSPWLTASGGALSPQRRAEMEDFIYNARREALEQAVTARPHPRLYDLLERIARLRPEPRPDVGPYFLAELKRLETMPANGADSSDIYRCRITLLDALKRRAQEAGELEEAANLDIQSRSVLAELTRQARWWQF